jgi:hypothetical protein
MGNNIYNFYNETKKNLKVVLVDGENRTSELIVPGNGKIYVRTAAGRVTIKVYKKKDKEDRRFFMDKKFSFNFSLLI